MTPNVSPKFSSAIDFNPKALLVFSSWGSAQPELQSPFLLLSRASPPFVSYDMDHLSTVKSKEGHGFLVPWKRTQEVHASCGAHASGLGAGSMGTANTRREKSLLMNRMTYARKQISRNGKRKWEKEIVNLSLELFSNTTWEVGE